MNRSRLTFLTLSLLLVLPLVATNLSARSQALQGEGDEDSLFKHLAVFTEVIGLVNQAYVEPSDEAKLMAGALDGATDALDPFSLYVPPEAVKSWKEAYAVGPGLSGLTLLRERGFIYVAGVAAGSPADDAGLQVGDMVAEINGENTNLTSLWQAQEVLTAKAGTKVALKIFRANEMLTKELKLGPYQSPPVELTERDGAAILRLYEFAPATETASGTADEAAAALKEVQAGEHDRLLLDLRSLTGGSAEEAYKVAALFVEGELGSLRDRAASLVSFRGQPPLWQGKVVLLVDRGTLGAAEILASILRQKVDAELVGERTFGHAGRLKGVQLASGGELWLTDAFYTGPDGEPLTESLQPDLFVSRRARIGDDEEEKDVVLEKGLERLLSDEEPEEAEQQAA